MCLRIVIICRHGGKEYRGRELIIFCSKDTLLNEVSGGWLNYLFSLRMLT